MCAKRDKGRSGRRKKKKRKRIRKRKERRPTKVADYVPSDEAIRRKLDELFTSPQPEKQEFLRYTPERPCPNCHGDHTKKKGTGERCFGGEYPNSREFFCSRGEQSEGCEPDGPLGTYRHQWGKCDCGKNHRPPPRLRKAVGRSRRKKAFSQGMELTRFAEQFFSFFRDQHGVPHVKYTLGQHVEACPVRSPQVRGIIARCFRQKHDAVPSASAIDQAIVQVEAICQEFPQVDLANRVRWIPPAKCAIEYDMGTAGWDGIVISADGWRIEKTDGGFRRLAHQCPQVVPAGPGEGDIREILRFVNVRPEDRLLFLATVVTLFVPDIPHPLMYLMGRQGSGKTTTAKLVRDIVDPSVAPVTALPGNERDMTHALAKNYLPIFDNVSGLRGWQSDALCRCVTGEATSKRKLYTDDGEHIAAYKHGVIVTAIADLISRPDLLDRTLIFELKKAKKFRSEEELLRDFEDAKPRILGGALDVLRKAMEVLPRLKSDGKVRMADFDKWGRAIALSLGYSPEKFSRDYKRATGSAFKQAAGVEPLVHALRLLVGRRKTRTWRGSPSELQRALKSLLDRDDMPPNARSLSTRLARLEPVLETVGITFVRKGTKSRPIFVITVARRIIGKGGIRRP